MIRLSQAAPWNKALTNPYRTRYAEHGGRYFRIEADRLDAPWFVWEIDREGNLLDGPDAAFVAIAMNLPQVRRAIEMRAAGSSTDEIRPALSAMGRAGTGRNHPSNVERRRRWHGR